MKKIAVLIMIFICFAEISVSFANTGHDTNISYKNDDVIVSTELDEFIH